MAGNIVAVVFDGDFGISDGVEVTTASGNWKHPLPLKIIFSAVSNGYYVLEMADTNSSHIT